MAGKGLLGSWQQSLFDTHEEPVAWQVGAGAGLSLVVDADVVVALDVVVLIVVELGTISSRPGSATQVETPD